MGERIALVGKIVPKQRKGMERHLALLSEGQPHCETWDWSVRSCLRERLQDQMKTREGLDLWVVMSGEVRWRFRISHALFFDQDVLARDPAHCTERDPAKIRTLLVYAAGEAISRRLDTLVDWDTCKPFEMPKGRSPRKFRYVFAE
ncbi:MAG: hypothetical protein FJX75_12555 [Armatimonadetes bacterium]|nr:hypothetical protein [Armatimonadota bacterium]